MVKKKKTCVSVGLTHVTFPNALKLFEYFKYAFKDKTFEYSFFISTTKITPTR